ncbi:MAG: hypothetical protein KDB35_06045 [Acidimicrobiales bacterium]|nr:hypothetical protein [Acidimicrobiales bacterium]MCB1013825.1 hypothetical protein [Acidimicrobiales bacterium]
MDDNRLGLPEILASAGTAVFLVATFLPWFDVSIGNDTSGILAAADFPSANGWDAGFLWSGVPLLLGLVLTALLLLPKVAPDLTLPALPPWAPLAVGGFAAFLVLLKILFGAEVDGAGAAEAFGITIDVSRSYGIFVAFLATLALTAAGFLALQRDAGPPSGGGGTAPPQPF